jgi:LmbE family N-acetylglucosaminyl deacetylase
MFTGKKFLILGAHPDDADLMFGGTALKLTGNGNGHQVKFVSVCNGDCGHFKMNRKKLAQRRYAEAQASAEISGIMEYQILDNSDCTLEASIANRLKVVKIIREFKPDVVISHRLNDYHVDHRNTAQLVQDASFLVMVPLYCPDIAIPDEWPVFAYGWDHFQNPTPFRADAIVIIDDVIEQKLAMLNCHTSQFYEWLPWNKGYKNFNVNKMTEYEKRQWLLDNWICRNIKQRELYLPDNDIVCHVEAFEQSEYGRQVSKEKFSSLFWD